jgi:putative phosphoesterase
MSDEVYPAKEPAIMRIGVLSDSHNDADFVKRALDAFRERGIRTAVHCGDLTSPEIVRLFEGFETHFVRGNMDARPGDIDQAIATTAGPRSYGRKWEGTLAGKRIAVCHGDDSSLLNELLWSGGYDYVFHGHTHRPRDERIGKTRVVNPGAHDTNTVCIVDLARDEVEFIELGTAR